MTRRHGPSLRLLALPLLLSGCFQRDVGIASPEDRARAWCPLETPDEFLAMATVVRTDQAPAPALPPGGAGWMDNDRGRPATLTLDWVTVDAELIEWQVDAADIPDLDARIDAYPSDPLVDSAMIRAHALPDLPGCQQPGVLGPVTVDVTLDGTTDRYAGELVLVGHSGSFTTDGIELYLSGGSDIVTLPMWLEQAAGPDWFWVSADL